MSTELSLAWPDRFFPFFFGVAEKRVWSGLQSLLVLAPPTVVGGVNGGNVICYCLIVTRAISVVLYKRVSSHIKDLWDRQKAQFHFNQRFQNGALCTSTWSVKQLPLFNTRNCIKERRAQAAACIRRLFSKDKYHYEIKVHVAINLYTTRLNYKRTRLQT